MWWFSPARPETAGEGAPSYEPSAGGGGELQPGAQRRR